MKHLMVNHIGWNQINKKIKKVFEKLDPELQEAVKSLINDIQVKREIKKLEKNENKAWLV